MAEDVVSETYVTAWRRLQVVPRTDDEARAWLCATARHNMANFRRRAQHQQSLAVELLRDVQPMQAEWPSERSSLVEAFLSLRPDDRQMLWYVATRATNTQELAHLLGCSEGAALVRLSRARKRLMTALGLADG